MKKAAQSAEIILANTNLPLKDIVGIASISGEVYCFQKILKNRNSQIIILQQKNEGEFLKTEKTFSLNKDSRITLSLKDLSYLSMSPIGKEYIGVIGFVNDFYQGTSPDGFSWKI